MDLVLFDTWAYGAELVPERYRGRRIGWADVWHRNSPEATRTRTCVSGLHPIVDLNTMELLELEDGDPGPPPKIMGEYAPQLVPGLQLRDDVKPLEITQPDGASFTLDGNQLRWQKWSMRLGFNYREGLVLHTRRLRGRRPACARSRTGCRSPRWSCRTATRRPDHYRRTAFDIGEWGLGCMTTSLELGCDCLGEISYLDAVLLDARGEPDTIKNAICIHEEDDGVLWKHVDDAHRRRDAADAPAGGLVPRHRGQLRVPRLLALLPGREHPVRGPRHRDHGHHPVRRRPSRRTAR